MQNVRIEIAFFNIRTIEVELNVQFAMSLSYYLIKYP